MLSRARTEAALGATFPLRPRRRVSGRPYGTMRASRRGGRSDPVSSRPYRPGDDLRLVDRHASARLAAARGSTDLVVREHFAEEAARVAIVVDPSPSMQLFPSGWPWLQKPAAVDAAAELISASAYRCRSRIERHDRLPEEISELHLPPGTFVFVLSDFLAGPPNWQEVVDRRLDVVPIVLQDPTWERSFPGVGGSVLPLPSGPTRLTRAEAAQRRRLNEERFDAILARFDQLDLEPVLLDEQEPDAILERFLCWAEVRRRAA
jgi:uncharacterized protein (DUF58 family)